MLMGWGSRAYTPTRSGRFLLLDVCAWTIMTGPIEICVFACKGYTIGDTKYIYEWSVGNYSRCMEYRLYMFAVSHERCYPVLVISFCWPRLAPMDDIDGVDVDDHAKIPRTPSTKGPARPGRLPFRLLCIMQILATAFVPMPELSCVDCFAGKRAISRAFTGAGEPAVALDILLEPNDDSWTWLWKEHKHIYRVKHGTQRFPSNIYYTCFQPCALA